jgi:hypothetical protein
MVVSSGRDVPVASGWCEVGSGFEQMRREAMTQGVRMDALMLRPARLAAFSRWACV